MPLALSTSWITGRAPNPQAVVSALKKLNIHGVELDYRLKRPDFYALRQAFKENNIAIVSLHNFSPCPDLIPNAPPSGDYFNLSALDYQERKYAVQWTIETIERANESEVEKVVLHCGSQPCPESGAHFYQQVLRQKSMTEPLRHMLTRALDACSQNRNAYLDALFFSLDQLVSVAEKQNVVLGLENRYHFYELPDLIEMETILKAFAGAGIGYWHDTGHAHVQEMIGLAPQKKWIDMFAEQLTGSHLHDAVRLHDHLAPGKGEIDFGSIQPIFDRNAPLVLKMAPGAAQKDLQQAVDAANLLIGRKDR